MPRQFPAAPLRSLPFAPFPPRDRVVLSSSGAVGQRAPTVRRKTIACRNSLGSLKPFTACRIAGACSCECVVCFSTLLYKLYNGCVLLQKVDLNSDAVKNALAAAMAAAAAPKPAGKFMPRCRAECVSDWVVVTLNYHGATSRLHCSERFWPTACMHCIGADQSADSERGARAADSAPCVFNTSEPRALACVCAGTAPPSKPGAPRPPSRGRGAQGRGSAR